MSITEDKLQLLDSSTRHQESFFFSRDQDADTPPAQLSGDQQGEQSVIASTTETNRSNFLLTTTLIIKTVIGSAILGLPYAVSKCGYLMAIMVFVVATSATQFSASLLLKAKNLSGHSNYSTIMYHIINHKVAKSIGSVLIFLNNLGICIAEIIIFKRTISENILKNLITDQQLLGKFYFSEYMIAIIIAFMETPFTLVKKIERLKFFALLGVIGIVVFIISFVIYYITTVSDNNRLTQQMNMFPDDWFEAAAAIPNIILALSYQMNFFPLFKGMKNSSDFKMKMASLAGVGICTLAYLLVGILGYSLLGSKVQGNFLLSTDYASSNKILYFIMNFGFLLSVFFAFPIMFFSCRNNFIALIQLVMLKDVPVPQKKWRQNSDNIDETSSYVESQDKNTKRKKANYLFLIYTFMLYLVIIGIGISVDNVEAVFNIVGAISATSISMLMPAYFYFALVIKKKKPLKIIFYLAIIMFVIMVPFGIFAVVAQYVK